MAPSPDASLPGLCEAKIAEQTLPRSDTGLLKLSCLGVALIVLTAAGLPLHVPGAITLPSPRATLLFVALMGVAALIYFAAVVLVLRVRLRRSATWLVLGIAVVLRVIPLPTPPFLSSDVFRYVWDGKVQNAGINPYRYLPADPALAALRDSAIYPHVNRATYARTIYPPMAQLIFRAVAAISPTILAMKLAAVAFELLAMGCIIAVLAAAGLPTERVLIYAWNPLAVWAFAGNGHVDAFAVGLIAAALLAQSRRHNTLTGALLGAAILVKFLPAAMAPALWRRRDWRMPAACAATILLLYACYIGVGRDVLGFLPGYASEEGLNQGTGLWLLAGLGDVLPLPAIASKLYLVIGAGVLVAAAAWVAFGSRPQPDPHRDIVRVAGNAAMLAAATLIVLSPHYAWYYAWLALPCCICPLRSVIYLSAAALLLYLDPLDEHFFWPSLVFVPCIALAVIDWRRPLA
ncbi:MAG TPA: glycosyltransferase family 87 protein, partial [Acetobacteraceae bacterium]